MKIWGEVPKVSAIYGGVKKADKVSAATGVAQKRDELTISGPAKDFQTVMKALKDVPEIREEKVAELGAKVDAGVYEVSSSDVSSKIIASLMSRRI